MQSGITDLLRQRHRIQPGADDDFMLRNQQELSEAMTATTDVMTALLAAIASVSLLVGGIGIMNIMLVSVTERTREIGIRMAVGARGRDILLQFLIEAVALSSTGGILGILLGVGGAKLITMIKEWPTWSPPTPSSSPSPSAPPWECSSASIPPAKPRSSIPLTRCATNRGGLSHPTSSARRRGFTAGNPSQPNPYYGRWPSYSSSDLTG